MLSAIKAVKARTPAPFGVNLRADAGDAAERIELIIAEKVPVASFALAPKKELIARLRDAGRDHDRVGRGAAARGEGRRAGASMP